MSLTATPSLGPIISIISQVTSPLLPHLHTRTSTIQSSSLTRQTTNSLSSIATPTTSQTHIGDPTTTVSIENGTPTISTDNGNTNISNDNGNPNISNENGNPNKSNISNSSISTDNGITAVATMSTSVMNTPSASTNTSTISTPSTPSTTSIMNIRHNSMTTSVSSPGSQDPTHSSVTAGKSPAPIIGGVIGGIIFVALSLLTAVMVIKRRRVRKQDGPVPTANPLLDDPHFIKLAAYSLSKKGPRPFHNDEEVPSADGISSEIQTQSLIQDQNTLGHSSPGPTLSPPRDFESAMQRQMEMIQSMSQRMDIMALELGAQQRGHQDADGDPPDYESRASI